MQAVLRILLVYLCVLQALYAGTSADADTGLLNPVSEFHFDQTEIHINPSIAEGLCFESNERENSENPDKTIPHCSQALKSFFNEGLYKPLFYSGDFFYLSGVLSQTGAPFYILYHSLKLPAHY
ncbi:MAG: hypothetical protein IPM26_13295 [Saprospiraceae bacterium]|nr:hypothetical protein [Saprospiraceae bacterium]